MTGSRKTLQNKYIPLLLLIICLGAFSGCSNVGEEEKAEQKENNISLSTTSPPKPEKNITLGDNKKSDTAINNPNETATAAHNPQPANNSVAGITEPINDLTRASANQILGFNNSALEKLQSDWIIPAENYYNLAHIYLRIFKIPSDLKLPSRKRQDLLPAKGLFSAEDEKQVYMAMDNMDKALASSNIHFNQLKKYLLDSTIQDNGIQGKKFVSMLEQDYKAFKKAQNIWQAIVKKYAERAERVILLNHPLSRQAYAASNIMETIVAANTCAKSANPDRQTLADLHARLNEFISLGSKPPFPATPGLERLYRIFLKNASIYADVLNRSALEGIYAIQKRELSLAGRGCSDTYNDFVRAFNETL